MVPRIQFWKDRELRVEQHRVWMSAKSAQRAQNTPVQRRGVQPVSMMIRDDLMRFTFWLQNTLPFSDERVLQVSPWSGGLGAHLPSVQ